MFSFKNTADNIAHLLEEGGKGGGGIMKLSFNLPKIVAVLVIKIDFFNDDTQLFSKYFKQTGNFSFMHSYWQMVI